MNKKKFLSMVCAGALVMNLGMEQPASAGIYFPNLGAGQQESQAKSFVKKEFGTENPAGDSEDAQRVKPILLRLQSRLCDSNGIEITEDKFRHVRDYKSKIHPIRMVDGVNNAFAMGAGYIYVGTEYVTSHTSEFKSPFDYILCEKMLAHELTHATEGHSLDMFHNYKAELKAERGSIRMMDKLPEGGWGAYLAALSHNMNRPKQNARMMKDFEEECQGRVSISDSDDSPKVTYHTGTGRYKLIVKPSNISDANSYFGGQLAYCIAKDALRLENIHLIKNNLKDTLNFKGNYLLVCCSDSKLPNGYRILTDGIYGNEAQAVKKMNQAKKRVQTVAPLSTYSQVAKESLYKDPDYWKIWLACAVANDMDYRHQ